MFPNILFKMPKFGKFSGSKRKNWQKNYSRKPHLGQKSVLQPALSKNQFSKPSNLAPIRSTSPHFRPFGPHIPTKMKIEYPPGVMASQNLLHLRQKTLVTCLSPLVDSLTPLVLNTCACGLLLRTMFN